MRRSVAVSTRIDRTALAKGEARSPLNSIKIDGRVRLSCGSVDVHTAQSQAIDGTPWDVPLPKTVTFITSDFKLQTSNFRLRTSRLNDALLAALGFDEPHAQLVEHLL